MPPGGLADTGAVGLSQSPPVPPSRPDRRSSIAIGMQWATRITSLAFEMVVPALLGYWGDEKWGTAPWLVITGAVVGMLSAGLHFKQIMDELAGRSRRSK
jgi:F0F1-type ATP synthase assembly protein I